MTQPLHSVDISDFWVDASQHGYPKVDGEYWCEIQTSGVVVVAYFALPYSTDYKDFIWENGHPLSQQGQDRTYKVLRYIKLPTPAYEKRQVRQAR